MSVGGEDWMGSTWGGREDVAREQAATEAAASVLVVDEFPITRVGLRAVLDGYPGLTVVGEADSAAAAEDAARALRPELIVIDPVMSRGDGFAAVRHIRADLPDARILVLTKSGDLDVAAEAVRCGANGILVKTVTQNALLNGIHRLLRGEPVIDPQVAVRAVASVNAPGETARSLSMPEPLTPRELEVLSLLSNGHSNPEIARRLFVAVGTVKVHVEHILGKLGASDRTDAAVRAVGLGLLTPAASEPASADRHMPPGS
ncbi:MAG TPA: response regulator transcription factor [Candidatus Limnocylindria bacterium]|nr:response regulator transcription factor [Candidatus Limnocylindria bacterium]